MVLPVRLGFLPVLGAISGCLTLNPAYEAGTSASASSSGAAPATTTVTSSTSSSGSSTASDDSGAITDGSATLEVSGTSGDASTSTSTSTGDTTTLEQPASTGIDATTGEPPPIVVDHYDVGQCQQPLWCFANQNINNGIPGEMRGAECFDAPLMPTFRVQRLHYVIAAVTGAPQIRFQVRDPALAQVLYESPPMAATPGPGTHEIPPQNQLLVGTTRFCVGFVGGDGGSTIGMAADPSMLPAAGQTLYGSQACNKQGLLDVNNFNPEVIPHGPWCLGAEITSK